VGGPSSSRAEEAADMEEISRPGSRTSKSLDDADNAIPSEITEPLKVFSATRRSWTATDRGGTGYTYTIVPRNDIDWTRARTGGDRRGIGLTNAEAARRFGLGPQLNDGFIATLHHLGQNARGPLVEASTRYHGVDKPLDRALHSQFGRRKAHPTRPVNRKQFAIDTREYWMWREQNR
jgi:hypothetical protein